MACASAPVTPSGEGGATALSVVHPDILERHILTRLDGPTLASASCVSTRLHALCSQENLWRDICHSTWQSTRDPRVHQLISTFPNGPRSFYSDSFPLFISGPDDPSPQNPNPSLLPAELISAVDVYYRDDLIFSKVQQTKTETGWFRCTPFRLDLLDPKEFVPTRIQYTGEDSACRLLFEELTLSWIMIDQTGRRAANLSSRKPVWVQRHWLSGERVVTYATILTRNQGFSTESVLCRIAVACGRCEGGKVQVREVSLQLEDIDGKNFNGEDSLVILRSALENGTRKKGRSEEGKERFEAYVEMKREWKERKLRNERRQDKMCMAFGFSAFTAFWILVLLR